MTAQTFAVRAESNPKFFRRFILMGIGLLAFAGWCVRDGAFKWPQDRIIYDAYHEIDELDRVEKWPIVAAENGWEGVKLPDKRHGEWACFMQLVMAVPIGLGGLWFLFYVWRSRGQWIEADEAGVASSWGKGFKWSEVTKLDKKKWRNKGLAKVHYEQDGAKRSFTIDDLKFHRQPTDEILEELERRIPREMIVNGPSEEETKQALAGSEQADAAPAAESEPDDN